MVAGMARLLQIGATAAQILRKLSGARLLPYLNMDGNKRTHVSWETTVLLSIIPAVSSTQSGLRKNLETSITTE